MEMNMKNCVWGKPFLCFSTALILLGTTSLVCAEEVIDPLNQQTPPAPPAQQKTTDFQELQTTCDAAAAAANKAAEAAKVVTDVKAGLEANAESAQKGTKDVAEQAKKVVEAYGNFKKERIQVKKFADELKKTPKDLPENVQNSVDAANKAAEELPKTSAVRSDIVFVLSAALDDAKAKAAAELQVITDAKTAIAPKQAVSVVQTPAAAPAAQNSVTQAPAAQAAPVDVAAEIQKAAASFKVVTEAAAAAASYVVVIDEIAQNTKSEDTKAAAVQAKAVADEVAKIKTAADAAYNGMADLFKENLNKRYTDAVIALMKNDTPAARKAVADIAAEENAKADLVLNAEFKELAAAVIALMDVNKNQHLPKYKFSEYSKAVKAVQDVFTAEDRKWEDPVKAAVSAFMNSVDEGIDALKLKSDTVYSAGVKTLHDSVKNIKDKAEVKPESVDGVLYLELVKTVVKGPFVFYLSDPDTDPQAERHVLNLRDRWYFAKDTEIFYYCPGKKTVKKDDKEVEVDTNYASYLVSPADRKGAHQISAHLSQWKIVPTEVTDKAELVNSKTQIKKQADEMKAGKENEAERLKARDSQYLEKIGTDETKPAKPMAALDKTKPVTASTQETANPDEEDYDDQEKFSVLASAKDFDSMLKKFDDKYAKDLNVDADMKTVLANTAAKGNSGTELLLVPFVSSEVLKAGYKKMTGTNAVAQLKYYKKMLEDSLEIAEKIQYHIDHNGKCDKKAFRDLGMVVLLNAKIIAEAFQSMNSGENSIGKTVEAYYKTHTEPEDAAMHEEIKNLLTGSPTNGKDNGIQGIISSSFDESDDYSAYSMYLKTFSAVSPVGPEPIGNDVNIQILDARVGDLENGNTRRDHSYGAWTAHFKYTYSVQRLFCCRYYSSVTHDVEWAKKHHLSVGMITANYSINVIGTKQWKEYTCVVMRDDPSLIYYYDNAAKAYVAYYDTERDSFFAADTERCVTLGAAPVGSFTPSESVKVENPYEGNKEQKFMPPYSECLESLEEMLFKLNDEQLQ